MKEIKELMGLGNGYEISKIDERIKNGKIIKQIYLFCTSKKVRCPKCNKFTSVKVNIKMHKKLKIKMYKKFT